MIPMQAIVTAVRPYAVVGAQSAAVGFCSLGGMMLGMIALAGTINGASRVVGAAKEAIEEIAIPTAFSGTKRRARARAAEQLEHARLRDVINAVLNERDQAAGKPSGWHPADKSQKPDGHNHGPEAPAAA